MTYLTIIRPCTPTDAPALALVAQATFLESYADVLQGSDVISHCQNVHSEASYQHYLQQHLQQPDYPLWLVETAQAAPVGYMMLSPPDLPLDDISKTDVELKRIYLLSRFQGGGMGKQLVHAAVAHAQKHGFKRLLLGVYGENDAAIGFYKSVGFDKVGERLFRVGDTDYQDDVMAMLF